MNAIQIKEKRLLMKLTQKKLANLIGVSTQTINGYENGKEIPSTNHQILESVLNNIDSNILHEPNTEYQKLDNINYEKLEQTIEKYNEVLNTIKMAEKAGDLNKIDHYNFISKLLSEQIKFQKKSIKIISDEFKILKVLNRDN